MQKTFLQAVGAVLTDGLKATVQLHGLANGQVQLIYTPDIGPTPENASEAQVNLRAAIAKPLVITGTPVEIEEAFAERIGEKAEVVKRGQQALDEIARLASAAVAEAGAKAASKPAPAQTVEPEDESEEEEDAEQERAAPAPVAPHNEPTPTASANMGASNF